MTPRQPTNEQWKALEDGLWGMLGRAELVVDGYALKLEKRQTGASTVEIMPFVDGWFRGEWITKDCEERRRFMRPVRVKLWTGKRRARLLTTSKRMRREMGIDVNAETVVYQPTWPTFGPLRRHLCRENDVIEIVEINGKPCNG